MGNRGIVVGIVTVAVAFAVGFTVNGIVSRRNDLDRLEALPLANGQGERAPSPDARESVRVVRVIDGDTVELESHERVRLIGIDAPERGSCFSDAAAATLSHLALGRMVQREWGIVREDRYGRSLNYLYDGATFINEVLVEQGAAAATPYPPDLLYASRFAEAERRARNATRGLWGACGSFPEEDGRITDTSVPSGCVIKGNISSSGERIYHLPSCGSYAKAEVDEGKGKRWFCTEEEAKAAGFRKAKNCPTE
jgi:micrococcal nuclease